MSKIIKPLNLFKELANKIPELGNKIPELLTPESSIPESTKVEPRSLIADSMLNNRKIRNLFYYIHRLRFLRLTLFVTTTRLLRSIQYCLSLTTRFREISHSITVFFILRCCYLPLLSFTYYITLSLVCNIVYAEEFNTWDQQWVQGAPLDKQPAWFRDNSQDPRSLYEQMNGPVWRDIHDYYDVQSQDHSYKGYGWNLPSYSHEVVSAEEILLEFQEATDNSTEDDFLPRAFSYIKENIPQEYFATSEQELYDKFSSIAQYLTEFDTADQIYTSRELAVRINFKSAVHTYNMALIFNTDDSYVLEKIYKAQLKILLHQYHTFLRSIQLNNGT